MSAGAEGPPRPSEDREANDLSPADLPGQDKSQVLSYKDIMLKNKDDLKRREEEVQAYVNKLSKIKSRSKLSRRSTEVSSSPDSARLDASLPTLDESDVTDVSDARTPKAKSHLLQKKLAENRKIFEQRSKEITKSNRAVEEKVQEIRKQITETELQKEMLSVPPIFQLRASDDPLAIQEKDNKIEELMTKVHELEAIIIDLQDSLKEKDSVIDSKMKAVALMSENLSKRGKTTLDTLEDTKDEMRAMQANFVLMETSFRGKHEHLLGQLEEKSNRATELEEKLNSVGLSGAMVEDMKREMTDMQENFALIESSLQDKVSNLIIELEDRKNRLAAFEVTAKESAIHNEEKIKRLEDTNRALTEEKEKYEKDLKNLRIQDEVIREKDDRVMALEKIVEDLKATADGDTETVQKLRKELDDLNKNMIKLKAQHKSKMRNFNKRLENFQTVSDVNAELVNLGNQVALLEEEKGNLQLSLVDFDELKASSVEVQSRIRELHSKVETQTGIIQAHVDAIAALENQKLDIMQELHIVKQEVSALEAENADCENLRVTAELKVVELEEQLESLNRSITSKPENTSQKDQFEEAEIRAVEPFESIEENRNDLLKQVDLLTQKNQDLEMQLREFHQKDPEEKKSSDTDSTESFDRISEINDGSTKNDADEGSALKKLMISEEKPPETSQNVTELHQRIENLVRENNDLVIELTKIQERLNNRMESYETTLRTVETHNSELRENLTILCNETSLLSLSTEITNCKKINENQMQLVENLEMDLLRNNQELSEKREEITECQQLIKNLTTIQSNLSEMEEKIEQLTLEKSSIFQKFGISSSDITELSQKSKDLHDVDTEKINSLLFELSAQRSTISSQDSEILSLKETHFRTLEELTQENSELKSTIDTLEKEKSFLSQENTHLTKQIELKKDVITSLEGEFKTTVSIIEDRLKDKEVMLMSSEHQIPLLQNELEEKAKEIAEFEKKIEWSAALVQAKEMALSEEKEKLTLEFDSNVASLEKVLENKTSLISSLQTEIQALLETLKNNEVTIITLQSEINSLHSALSEKEMPAVLMAGAANVCQELLVEKESLYQSCTSTLASDKSEFEAAAIVFEEKTLNLEAEVENCNLFITKLKNEIENITEMKISVENENEELKLHKLSLENSVVEVNNALAECKMALESVTIVVNQKNDENRNLELMNDDANNRMKLLDKDLNDRYNELELYKTEFDRKELTISDLKDEIDRLSETLIENERNSTALQAEIMELQESSKAKSVLRSQNEALVEQVTEKEKNINNLESSVNNITKRLEETKREVEELEALLNDRESKLSVLSDEKEILMQQILVEKQSKYDALSSVKTLTHQIENQTSYIEEIRGELNDAYRMMEQLKQKHAKDVEMQNQRLEETIIDLHNKTSEYNQLSLIVEEKQRIIGDNVTAEIKGSLEQRIVSLETELEEVNTTSRAQLQKMKIIAANLKKKTAQVQDLEARAHDFTEKWMNEKSEKENVNNRLQQALADVQVYSNTVDELKNKLSNYEKNASESIQRLSQEIIVANDEIIDLNDRLKLMKSEVERLSFEIERHSRELESKESKIQLITSEFQFYKEISESERRKGEEILEVENSELSASKEKIELLNETIWKNTQDSTAMQELYQFNMTSLSSEIIALKTQIDELEDKIEFLNADIQQKTRNAKQKEEAVQSRLQSAVDKMKFYEKEMRKAEDTSESLKHQLALSTEEMNHKSSEISSLSLEIVSTNKQIDTLTLEINAKTQEISSLTSELSLKSDTLSVISSQIDQKNQEISSLKTQFEPFNDELNHKSSEIAALSSELMCKNERIDSLTLEIDQKNEEISSLTSELLSKLESLSSLSSDIVSEKEQKLSLSADLESLRTITSSELSALSQKLDDSKERARELGVRMQVMETEYVEQLNTIQTLRTENGLLASKRTQLNERLENTETESIERLGVIETLRSDIIHLKSVQTPPTNCDHCDRCQELVNALEGKLQERNAEIQNLDNELANSVANFLQMRENLRTQELQCSEESQEARKSLAQFNDLLARNTENEKNTQHLHEQIISLNERNCGLHEELVKTREIVELMQHFKQLYLNLSKVHEEKEKKLEELTKKLQQLQIEEDGLLIRVNEENIPKIEGPKLFDAAKLFDAPTSRDTNPSEDILSLRKQLEAVQTERNQLLSRLDQLTSEVSSYTQEILLLTERNRELAQMSAETHEIKSLLIEHEQQIQFLSEENNQLRAELFQRQEFIARSVEDLRTSGELNDADFFKKKNEDLENSILHFITEAKALMPNEESEVLNPHNYVIELTKIISTIRSLQQRIIDLSLVVQKTRGKTLEEIEEDKEERPPSEALKSSSTPLQDEEICLDDEEEWGWSAQYADLDSGLPLASICTGETQLRAKIAELGDTIKDLEDERLKMKEDVKVAQIRSSKLVKKLKEFKVQNENLQKQLKLQRSSGELCDLDSAIEEELRSQIATLEKYLSELRSDHQKVILDRENLTKRIDVLMAANERFTEMKERQDREVEVLQIRNKELLSNIEVVEKDITDKVGSPEICETVESRRFSKELYDELQDSLEMLAAENEQLRTLLEAEKSERLAVELSSTETMREIEESKNQTDAMKIGFDASLKKCQNLQKECIGNLETMNQKMLEAENNHGIILGQALQRSKELEDELNERKKRIRSLEESLNISQQHLNEVRETLLNVTELLNERVQEVAELRQQIQLLQGVKIEAATCRVNVDDLNKKLMESEENMSRQLNQQEENLSRKLIEKEEDSFRKLTQLKEDLTRKSIETEEDLLRQLSNKDAEIVQLKKLQADFQETSQDMDSLNSKVDELSSERETLISTIEGQTQELQSLKELLDKTEWLVETLNTESAAHKDTIFSLDFDLQSSKEEINLLTVSITSLGSEITEKVEELASQVSEIDSLKSIIANLQSKLEEPNYEMCPKCKQNERVLSESETLREQLQAKGMEIEDLKYILNQNTYPRIFQELQDRVNSLYNEKSQLESSLKSALQQIHGRDASMAQEAFLEDETLTRIDVLHKTLSAKEGELESLKKKLEGKTTECSLLENALAKQISSSTGGESEVREHSLTSSELDVALYMLHQRDVRCEELTHELMQLLEERDTLQLRLSNAIRLNEEMRRGIGELDTLSEQPATVEAMKQEKRDTSEDKTELAQKLSQLHTVGHRRDIRLMDDRELRNTQQMSLLAHKDALSTLPPDAAARLINANYTLSRDVQSQSSILLNWLWGKSTPKVVHM